MGLPKPEAIAILVQEGFNEASASTSSAIHRDFVARSIAFYERIPGPRGPSHNPRIREAPKKRDPRGAQHRF